MNINLVISGRANVTGLKVDKILKNNALSTRGKKDINFCNNWKTDGITVNLKQVIVQKNRLPNEKYLSFHSCLKAERIFYFGKYVPEMFSSYM